MCDINWSCSKKRRDNFKEEYEKQRVERRKKEAESETLIGKKREMVCPVIIFVRKTANKSSSVELLVLEFVKS